MRGQVVVASLATIALLVMHNSVQADKGEAFQSWKQQFQPQWAPEEDAFRRLMFERNMLEIEKHNANKSKNYRKGVNQFTVLSGQQFASRYLTLKVPSYDRLYDYQAAVVPPEVDWVSREKVSAVKNQGYTCGSCWTFSATAVLESFYLFQGINESLSEQQLLDCDWQQNNKGCGGGWPKYALDYVALNGITTEANYPYRGVDGMACRVNGGYFKISGDSRFEGCRGLARGIQKHPLSVTVNSKSWNHYRQGVMDQCGTEIDHAVLLVGVIGGNWRIKNSWGTSWGENGYITLLGTGNTCGICHYAGVYPK